MRYYAFVIPSLLVASFSIFAFSAPAFTQETIAPTASPFYTAPPGIIEKIKDEGLNHSEVMKTLTYLTETFGPRLTGSPNLKAANEWTRSVMVGRGMTGRLEPWGPFGRGWSLKEFSAQMNQPYALPLVGYPKAWGPSTRGKVTGEVVYFNASSEAEFAKYKGKLRGKIVLIGSERKLKSIFEPLGTRKTDEGLERTGQSTGNIPLVPTPAPIPNATATPTPTAAPTPTPQPIAQPTPQAGSTPTPPGPPRRFNMGASRMSFFLQEGVALVMDNSSAGSNGTVFVAQATVAQDTSVPPEKRTNLPPYDKKAQPQMVPQMTLSSEHWNRLYRLAIMGQKPVASVNIGAQYHDKDPMAYNTIAEIPGTDKKDEVVMLGGHMDSWHGGTGATDNGCNIAVAMEAARIIQKLGVQPRRTIRVALWTGEEQGLLGSAAYVKAHFGESKPGPRGAKPEIIKLPDYEKLSAYYNLDNGAGKIRGIYAQNNNAAGPIFTEWLKPFAAMGAQTMTLGNTTSTDHISFDRIGLPGFQFIQDDLDYWSQTHHSTQDVLERVPEEDIKFNATILAAFVFQTAMMEERMPRKPE